MNLRNVEFSSTNSLLSIAWLPLPLNSVTKLLLTFRGAGPDPDSVPVMTDGALILNQKNYKARNTSKLYGPSSNYFSARIAQNQQAVMFLVKEKKFPFLWTTEFCYQIKTTVLSINS